jgi:SMODS and SLOG-associating 2TM effector domain 1
MEFDTRDVDEDEDAGTIPFRIRIGVTGHRNLESTSALAGLTTRVLELVPSTPSTDVRPGVVSALAEGADRLVADKVFDHASRHGQEARLEVVLPVQRDVYVRLQKFSNEATTDFEWWMDRASSLTELGGDGEPEDIDRAYEAASHHLVARSDVLVALWDGQPSRGKGGTADTLVFAAELGKPCIWLPTYGVTEPRDNLQPGSADGFLKDVCSRAELSPSEDEELERNVLGTLLGAFEELDEFNNARLPSIAHLRRRAESELGPLSESDDWVALPFARAAMLADRFQKRFMLATWLIALFAIAAASALSASVSQEHPSHAWAWAEVVALSVLFVVFLYVHRRGVHRRWLSYRLLSERFRTAFFIAPVGVDFRRTAGLETIFVERRSADWLQRAFEEVWEVRPRTPQLDFESLRRHLVERWIGGQIEYHAKAFRQHERNGLIFTSLILLCFFGTVLFAALHATDAVEQASIWLTITLPVAAAALGVALTVRQHRALADRYRRMHADLKAVRRAMLTADADTLEKTAQEAARLIAEENGDWLGAMWFLDLESPG